MQFEIAVFNNGVLMEVSNFASLTLEIKAEGENGAPPDPADAALMSKTISSGALNNGLVLADWNSGIDEHGVIAFTGGEANVAADKLWLGLRATTSDSPGRTITLAAGPIVAAEDGVGLTTTPAPPQEVYYTAAESDARFAQAALNLSDLGSAGTARTNLGLGTAATLNTGTSAGDAPVLDGGGKLEVSTIPVIAPSAHAASHTDGSDDIQDATAAQKGLATATQISKLDGVAAGAEVNLAVVSQVDAEAGLATDERIWTALRVGQAIAAQGTGLTAAQGRKLRTAYHLTLTGAI